MSSGGSSTNVKRQREAAELGTTAEVHRTELLNNWMWDSPRQWRRWREASVGVRMIMRMSDAKE